jgi:hypothetical protein
MSEGLRSTDELLVGSWLETTSGVTRDETCKRIEWLVQHSLEHVADHPGSGAWESLFRDPADGRYWERSYPQGQMHGGGPPALRHVTEQEVNTKYFRAAPK